MMDSRISDELVSLWEIVPFIKFLLLKMWKNEQSEEGLGLIRTTRVLSGTNTSRVSISLLIPVSDWPTTLRGE